MTTQLSFEIRKSQIDNILGRDIEKGGEGSGRHKDQGHRLAERLIPLKNKLKFLTEKNLSIEAEMSSRLKEGSNSEGYKRREKEFDKNKKEIDQLNNQIKKLESGYNPDAEFEI